MVFVDWEFFWNPVGRAARRKNAADQYTHLRAALKRPRLSKIEAALKEKLTAAELARVHFLSPEELFTMLSMRPKTTETVVGGYKVKVRHEAVDPDEAAARYKALTEVVAKSVRRMKGGEKP